MREINPSPPVEQMLAALRPVGKVRTGPGSSRRKVQRKSDKRPRPVGGSIPMTASARGRYRMIGLIVSVLVHVGLIIYSVTWLMQRAQIHVERGETSTTITLTLSTPHLPTPPALVPPTPAPTTPPVTPITPAVIPVAIQPQALPILKPIAITHPPAIIHSKPPLALAKPKTTLSAHTTSSSHGATQAQPDDLHNEPPEYPEESQRAREQGVVILKVEVTAAGEPAQVSVLQSSGFPRLDQAARQAVRHWHFHPALQAGGLPVSSEADVPVHFKLQAAPSY